MGVLPVGPGAMSRPFRAPGHGRGRALFHPCILSLGAGGKEQVGWAGSVLVSVGEGRGGPACPSRCDLMGGGTLPRTRVVCESWGWGGDGREQGRSRRPSASTQGVCLRGGVTGRWPLGPCHGPED